MIKYLLIFAILTFCNLASAAGLCEFEISTTRTDGSVLLLSEIQAFVAKYSINGIEQPSVTTLDNSEVPVKLPGGIGTYIIRMATVTAEGVGPYSEPTESYPSPASPPLKFECRQVQ